MINLAAASHDTAHWGHVGAHASCGVLDKMAGGWRGVLGMKMSLIALKYHMPMREIMRCNVQVIFLYYTRVIVGSCTCNVILYRTVLQRSSYANYGLEVYVEICVINMSFF